jgi:GntR family transcriptional regulator/MocR family aminotransferase
MVLPDRLMESYSKTLGFYSCTVPVYDQYVLAEYIASGAFERHLNRIRRRIYRLS